MPAITKPVLAEAEPKRARAATTSAHPAKSKKKPAIFKEEPPRGPNSYFVLRRNITI